MANLMLHCGSEAISRQELAQLPVPEARGSRHVIRPFIEDVELAGEYMRQHGLTIQSEAFGVLKDKNTGLPSRFFGLMEVVSRDVHGEEYGLMVGMRGSYDQSLPRGLAVGSRVFVCDNLAFSGEVEIKTRQTTFIAQRIPALLDQAVGQIPYMAEAQERRFQAYRNVPLKPRHGDAALVELVRRGALTPSQLGRAIEQWDAPVHPEHAEQGRSVWRLHNAVTEAMKPANPERMALHTTWERTRKLTSFLDEVVGL